MRLVRVTLQGWTSSFRYPRLISGDQPSLKAPPPSTVYGLVSAAKGCPVTPEDTPLGYVFRFMGMFEDLEALQKVARGKTGGYESRLTPDIVRRQVLYDWTLYLYCQPDIAATLQDPYYPLLLGRSSDLALVVSVDDATITRQKEAVIGGTVFPLTAGVIPAQLVSLPLWCTACVRRERRSIQVLQIVSGQALQCDETIHDPRSFTSWQWASGTSRMKVQCWVDEQSGYGFYLYGA